MTRTVDQLKAKKSLPTGDGGFFFNVGDVLIETFPGSGYYRPSTQPVPDPADSPYLIGLPLKQAPVFMGDWYEQLDALPFPDSPTFGFYLTVLTKEHTEIKTQIERLQARLAELDDLLA